MRVNVWAEDWEVPGDEPSAQAPQSGVHRAGAAHSCTQHEETTEPTDVAPLDLPRASAPVRASGRYHELAPAHGCTRVPGLSSVIPPDGVRGPRWDEPAQLRADQHFCTAELLLERGHVREAVLEAQRAMRLYRPRPDQEALYAWLLAERSGAGHPVPQCVWERLESALAADPACARALAYMARLQARR